MDSQVDSPTPPAVNPQQGGQNTAPPSEINIAFINCVGQTKFLLPKQLEIQSYVQTHKIDILHLQECMIDEQSLSECPHMGWDGMGFTVGMVSPPL